MALSTEKISDRVQDAWQLVTRLHANQTYGGPAERELLPYLSHIGGVAFEVMQALRYEPHADVELACLCALLHDSLEDTPHTYEAIVRQFGESVAAGVGALTKDPSIADKPTSMRDSLARIKQQPREVAMVKLADRICNLYAAPFYWDEAKKKAYREEATLILTTLSGTSAYLEDRLRRKIAAYIID